MMDRYITRKQVLYSPGSRAENHIFSSVCLYTYYLCIYIQICHIDMSIVYTPPHKGGGVE
jgi:hypothetical protein